uniref:Alpha-ketoglutarate-dependent dioxygenase AlkB-like domain-containing protein n=1 Tax=Paramoeba aestuarina TaxID=180227 RepID=A0A7S4PFJ8_9EUKA|mmetsp:Transcript_5508/g.8323  ORF Transcript_5508/g.8323 Transcript_5508/m.8323 type:complete len:251 (+) Transcript_5508:3-755(+)
MLQEELERIQGGTTLTTSPPPSPSPSSPPSPRPSCPPPKIVSWQTGKLAGNYEIEKGQDFLYCHNFVSEEEEQNLMASIYHEYYASAWVTLKRRRLQQWGGSPSLESFVPDPLPDYTEGLVQRICEIEEIPIKSINHILINEYLPGQGISRHKDGPLYEPHVAILSLSSPILLNFSKHLGDKTPSLSLCLHPRSLFVFYGSMYHNYYHGIEERIEDEISSNVLFREKLPQFEEKEKEKENNFVMQRKLRK